MATMAKSTKARVTSLRPAWWRAPPGERSIIHPIPATQTSRTDLMISWEVMAGSLLGPGQEKIRSTRILTELSSDCPLALEYSV